MVYANRKLIATQNEFHQSLAEIPVQFDPILVIIILTKQHQLYNTSCSVSTRPPDGVVSALRASVNDLDLDLD